jgi:hypothetical protein
MVWFPVLEAPLQTRLLVASQPSFVFVVPVLLQVQEVFISFSAKLNSIARTESTSDSLYKDSVNVESWDRFGTTSTMSASYSDKKSTRSGSTEEREFSLHVTLKARQADMPVGIGRILDILEEANLVK